MSMYRTEKDFLRSLKRFNALSSKKYEWHTGVSSKQHRCEFGHTIEPESLYFKKPLDMDGESKMRVCSTCMQVLVFLTVDIDVHSKEVSEQLYRKRNPVRGKISKAMAR
jgi:hypothetical protein